MRILQVIPAFYPSKGYGGGPIVAYEISKRLVRRGYNIVVYTTDANDKTSRLNSGVKNIDGIEVHYFRNISNYIAYNYKIFLSIGMITVIKEEIDNFDIVHIHDYRTLQNILIYYNTRIHKIPYIVQPHGTIPKIGKSKLKSTFDMLIGYKILKSASKLLVLNYSELVRCKPIVDVNKIHILPNGINLSEYCNLPREGVFREKFSIDPDEKIVLYLGRIHESKGIELLVRAFAKMSRKVNNVKLVIIGPDDGYLHTLYRLANHLRVSDKLIITGFLPHEDKLSAYVDADVFVTPTFYGFPLTFLEAMVCGTPIVTTTKGDYIEGINNKVGFVVQYREQELENAIHRILVDDELSTRFSRNAKKEVKKYDWENIVDRLEKIYYEVLEGHS